VNGTSVNLPPDKVITRMLQEVCQALAKLEATYSLGGESLMGFAEGDITKYKYDIYLYLFKLSLFKKIRLFLMLLSKGITLKPKRKWGHIRFKLRSPRKKGEPKHPYVIYLFPVKKQNDEAIVYAGGHTNRFDYQDLNSNKLQKVQVEDTTLTLPQELDSFVSKYRKQLLSESYKRHPFHFTPKNRKHAHNLLRNSCEILEELGIHYWLDFGTLLGLIRENKLIDWDKDMDLSIRFESDEKIEELISALSNRYPVKLLAPSIRPDSWKLGKYRTIKAFHQKYGFIRTDPHLDFFTQYRGQYDNQSETTYRSIIAGVNNEIPASFVDELDSFNFEGHEYAIPNHAEDFLALRYGADWRTPKQYWHPAYDDQSMVRPE
jgi:lipopolysaccharide cholinephosphotransferase